MKNGAIQELLSLYLAMATLVSIAPEGRMKQTLRFILSLLFEAAWVIPAGLLLQKLKGA